jgi:hypothetical protein
MVKEPEPEPEPASEMVERADESAGTELPPLLGKVGPVDSPRMEKLMGGRLRKGRGARRRRACRVGCWLLWPLIVFLFGWSVIRKLFYFGDHEIEYTSNAPFQLKVIGCDIVISPGDKSKITVSYYRSLLSTTGPFERRHATTGALQYLSVTNGQACSGVSSYGLGNCTRECLVAVQTVPTEQIKQLAISMAPGQSPTSSVVTVGRGTTMASLQISGAADVVVLDSNFTQELAIGVSVGDVTVRDTSAPSFHLKSSLGSVRFGASSSHPSGSGYDIAYASGIGVACGTAGPPAFDRFEVAVPAASTPPATSGALQLTNPDAPAAAKTKLTMEAENGAVEFQLSGFDATVAAASASSVQDRITLSQSSAAELAKLRDTYGLISNTEELYLTMEVISPLTGVPTRWVYTTNAAFVTLEPFSLYLLSLGLLVPTVVVQRVEFFDLDCQAATLNSNLDDPGWRYAVAGTEYGCVDFAYDADDTPDASAEKLNAQCHSSIGSGNRTASAACLDSVRAAPGRLSALSVFLLKSILYGAFCWARRVLKHQKRRFPARAVPREPQRRGAPGDLQRVEVGARAGRAAEHARHAGRVRARAHSDVSASGDV